MSRANFAVVVAPASVPLSLTRNRYDELHPAARMEEIIAKNFLEVVNGDSKYGTYYR